MARRDALRVVCYAVNGTGVGHITRLLSIARWMRRYAAALDQKLEIWFLTSSEAEGLAFAEGFAAFKIPSKTIVAEVGIDRTAYVALAKQWIWHTLGLLRPDLLIVDTFPRGSFGELLGALDLCRRSAFVYRPVRRQVAERPDFQAMLPLYDLLLVPETDAPVLVPPKVEDRLVHVGPVLSRERWELMPRDVAREALGIADDERCVFVSAGGGGDRDAAARIEAAVRALAADPSMHVVVGAGPLHRGQPFPGVTIVPGRAAEWSLAFDAAVCAAGYNTFGELMFAGVPTAFLPQDKLADDQAARAQLAVERGAGVMLEVGASAEDIHAAVADLVARSGAREAARSLVPENGARAAAAELMRLVCPAASVDRVEAALDDERLAAVVRAGDVADGGHRGDRGAGPAAGIGTRDKHELEVLALAARLAHGCDDELGVAVERAARLLAGRDAAERREVRGLVDAVTRGLPSSGVEVRAAACDAAVAALVAEALGVGALGPGDGALGACALGPGDGALGACALGPGDGAAARAAVADGRWGEACAATDGGPGSCDGALLARAMRHAESSSSLRSTK